MPISSKVGTSGAGRARSRAPGRWSTLTGAYVVADIREVRIIRRVHSGSIRHGGGGYAAEPLIHDCCLLLEVERGPDAAGRGILVDALTDLVVGLVDDAFTHQSGDEGRVGNLPCMGQFMN